jgi:zinc protease
MTATPLNMASLPNPETLTRRVFPNEVVGLAWENYSSPSVVIHGWLRAGNVDVPPEKAGLSSMTASLLTHGTERRSFSQIGEEIESVGATLSVGSSGHTTGFTAKCLVEDLPLILDVMTDCLYHPTFPAEYVEKRRGEILTAIRQRENNTQSMASLRLHETMYVHHPYGQSQLGYRETVENLTREDVQQFYRDHYGTSGMGVVIVGAISQGKGPVATAAD